MPQPPLPSNLSVIKRVAGTQPAAGAEASTTVPGDKFWMLLGYSVSLAQGLTQTPLPVLVIDDGTNIILELPGSSTGQASSTTCQYTWAQDLQVSGQIGTGTGVVAGSPLPGSLILPPGYRVRTSTIGIGANSQYAAASLFVAELG